MAKLINLIPTNTKPKQNEALEDDKSVLKETSFIKGTGKETRDLNYTLTNLQSIYNIRRQDMEALIQDIKALIK